MAPLYSIIIPAFNEEAFLPSTLAFVKTAMAAVPEPGELIVVDNNSTDETARVATARGARVVFEPVNQISRARNAGAAVAAGRFFVFLDADTRIEPVHLRLAIGHLGSDVCGGGACVRFDEPVGWPARLAIAGWNALSRGAGLAAGSFFYCRADAFEAAGGFSRAVYAGEELWLSLRLKKWGRKNARRFRILREPVATSGRKVRWFSPLQLVFTAAIMVLFPPAARFKSLCFLWYRRPPRRLK